MAALGNVAADQLLRLVQMLGISRAAKELGCQPVALHRAIRSGETSEQLEQAAATWLRANIRTLN